MNAAAAEKLTPPAEREAFAAWLDDEESCETVRALIPEFGWDAEQVHTGGIGGAVRALTGKPSARLLIVDISGSGDIRSDMAALAEVCEPGTVVIVLGVENDVSLFRDLLSAGIHDYLLKPLQAGDLRDSLVTAHAALDAPAPPQAVPHSQSAQKVTGIIGVHGGVGASLIAAGLAYELATRQGQKVALFDLDIHFGSGALNFDLEPGKGLADAMESPSRIDDLFIQRATVRDSEQLAILGAEHPLSEALHTDPEATHYLLGEIRKSHDHVIVDMPRSMVPEQEDLLRAMNTVCLVADLSLVSTRDTLRLLTHLRQIKDDSDIRLIVNRTGLKGGTEVNQRDFESSIEKSVDWALPEDRKSAIQAARRGRPVTDAAKSSVLSKGLSSLAAELADSGGKTERKSIWSSFKALKAK